MVNFPYWMQSHQQRSAEPHKKARRQLVKQLGKRQARQLIRNRRSLAKVEAQIAKFAKQHEEKLKTASEVQS